MPVLSTIRSICRRPAAIAMWSFAARLASPAVSQLLVLRATGANRRVAAHLPEVPSAAYPAHPAAAVESLEGGTPWPGAALVWGDVTAGQARLRRSPPKLPLRAVA